MFGMLIGAGVGAISGIFTSRAQAREMRRKVRAQRVNVARQYSAVEAAVKMQVAVNKENGINAAAEAMRVAEAKKRQSNQAISVAAGKLQAQSEGLTAGRSKGRLMSALYQKGTKALQSLESQKRSMIGQISDKVDSQANELINKQFQAYNNMASVFKQQAPSTIGVGEAMLTGAIKGAQIGASLTNSFNQLSTTPNTSSIIGSQTTTTTGPLRVEAVVNQSGAAGGVNYGY